MASATPDLRLPSQPRGITAPLPGTKLYCLVTEAHVCEQLAQGCYLTAERPGAWDSDARLTISQHHAPGDFNAKR